MPVGARPGHVEADVYAAGKAQSAVKILKNQTLTQRDVVQRIIGGKNSSPGRVGSHAASTKNVKSSHSLCVNEPTVQYLTVDENAQAQRLDNFLLRHLKGAPKTLIYRIVRSGEVRVNKGRVRADTRLSIGDVVRVPPLRLSIVADKSKNPAAAPAREFPVVFEDDHLLVIDKPAGVAVHGGSGVSFGVIEQLRQARPQARFLELVHRLDKETSGLLMIAKKRSALTGLQDQLRERQTGKIYAALVVGAWPKSCHVIDQPLHKYLTPQGERRVRIADAAIEGTGRRSITLVRVQEAFENVATLLEVSLKTGRTHQIRVHLAAQGHPIIGDEKYGDFAQNKTWARGFSGASPFSRMFLHAQRLRFTHPADARDIELEAPLPSECRALLAALKSN